MAETCPSIRECDSRHAILGWILAIAATVLLAIFGGLYHKIDGIQADITTIKVSIQRIEDHEPQLAAPASAPVFLASEKR